MAESFDMRRFRHELQTTWLGSETIYIEKIHSTNSFLKESLSGKFLHGTVAITDHQTGGRGQYERKWHSEPGKNLTFTVAFRPKQANRLNLLSLASAYAVARAVELYLESEVKLKWPNDVIATDKKVGGYSPSHSSTAINRSGF